MREDGDSWILKNGHELGMVYAEQAEYEKACIQHKEMWTDRKKALGDMHESTLESATQVVQTLKQRKRFNEALSVLEPIWAARQGELSGNALTCAGELGKTYYSRSENEKAEVVLSEVWPATKKTQGPTSQEASARTYRLGTTLWRLDKNKEAKAIFEELAEIRKTSPHPWPDEGDIAESLALTLLDMKKLVAAEKQARLSWDLANADPKRGPDHPTSLARASILMAILFEQPRVPRLDEASQIYETIYPKREALLTLSLTRMANGAESWAAMLEKQSKTSKKARRLRNEAAELDRVREEKKV